MLALPVQQHCQYSSIASTAALPAQQQHCQHGSIDESIACTAALSATCLHITGVLAVIAAMPAHHYCQHDSIASTSTLPAQQNCRHCRIISMAALPAWHLCQQSSIASYLSSCPQRACFPYAIYTLREQNTIKSVSKELQGGPPLTQFSLPWVLLPWFLAYV